MRSRLAKIITQHSQLLSYSRQHRFSASASNQNASQQQQSQNQQQQQQQQQQQEQQQKASFGFRTVNLEEKQSHVDGVFHSVADKYDLMNDLMSLGIHRCWKETFVNDLGVLLPQTRLNEKEQLMQEVENVKVLDVAGGTGDIAFKIIDKHRNLIQFASQKGLEVTVLDINESMLKVGQQRAQNLGYNKEVSFVHANAEELPFKDETFDAYTISFGLRNVPRIEKALSEAHRVLKKGGRLMIMEFSKVTNTPLNYLYQFYNFNIVPTVGQLVTGDRASYQYLAESIEKFHDQQSLLSLVQQAGFKYASYKNLNEGIVAIHSGFKL